MLRPTRHEPDLANLAPFQLLYAEKSPSRRSYSRQTREAGYANLWAAEHKIERSKVKKSMTTRRSYVFIAVWIPTTIIIGWRVLAGDHTFDSPFMWLNLLTLLICTLVLL